jgi:hypothetical protein
MQQCDSCKFTLNEPLHFIQGACVWRPKSLTEEACLINQCSGHLIFIALPSQDSGCNGELETADHLNTVSPTVLSPLALTPTNSMKLGDSTEAVTGASQGEGHVLMHQHLQPSVPSELLPLRANYTAGTESAWAKDQ